MRYFRVLTGLALVGVAVLAATLIRLPTPVRATTTHQRLENTLHGVLGQAIQGLAIVPGLRQKRVAPLAVGPQGQTCPVDGCSLKGCVEFAQGGGAAPVTSSGPAVLNVTPQAGPPARSTCVRHGYPKTQWVNGQTIVAQPVGAPTPVVSPPPVSSTLKHTGP